MRKRTKARLLHRLGAWALALCLVAGLLPGTAFAAETEFTYESDDRYVQLTYTVDELGNATITKGKLLTSETAIIPSTIPGTSFTVTAIGDRAFKSNYGQIDASEVIIPAAVTTIGEEAFFSNSKLQTVTFEEGSRLQSIGEAAFQGCEKLTSINLPDNEISIGYQAFWSCDSLASIHIPAKVRFEDELYTHNNVFARNPFYACTGLTTITVAQDNPYYTVENGVLFSTDGKLLCFPNSLDLTTYEIPENVAASETANVTKIAQHAFYKCAYLEEVTIPASVQYISYSAFQDCEALNKVTINTSELLSRSTFMNCNSLATVVFNAVPSAKSVKDPFFPSTMVERIIPSGDPESGFTVSALSARLTSDLRSKLVFCAVKFDKNGGSGSMLQTSAYARYKLPEKGNNLWPPAGKTFQGWSTSADGTSDIHQPGDIIDTGFFGDGYVVQGGETLTLYAIWGNKPTGAITSVTVTPTSATVEKGSTNQFTATVTGTGNYDQTVNWTVEGGTSGSTTISADGLLTVAADETATSLTVKATANGDSSKSATATVTVQAAAHTHTWEDEWTRNNTHHWHECIEDDCPVTDDSQKRGYAEHAYDQQVVSDRYKESDATCTQAATYRYSCVCGASGTETFTSGEALGHDWGEPAWSWSDDGTSATVTFTCNRDASHTESPEVTITSETTSATCTESGTTVYTASVTFNGEDCSNTNSVMIAATGHSWGAWTSAGNNKHTRTCSACDATETENCSGGEATCTQKATCTICNSQYGELNLNNHNPASEWTQENGKHYHTCENGCGTHLNEVECSGGTATCTNKATCSTCSHEYGEVNPGNHTGSATWVQTATTHKQIYDCCQAVVIDEANHTWENGTCSTCGYNCNHTGGTATCTSKATCSTCGHEYGEVNPDNHTWGEPVWTWAEDGKSATVTFTCANDSDHTQTVDATITSEVKTPATCTESGTTIYTASVTFNEKDYSDTKSVTIAATGHTTGTEWKSDAQNHWKVCSVCNENTDQAAHTFSGNTCTVCGYTRASGSSGSSGGGSATYPPIIEDSEGGDTTVSPSRPSSGQTVTITPDPDKGYEVEDVTVTDAKGNEVKVTENGDGTYSFRQPSGRVTIEVTYRATGAAADCPRDDTCPLAKFTDLDRNAWYHDGIHYCVENGLMAGTNATTFAPDVTTSRAMIAVILWRQEGSPIVEEYTDFSDVADGAWYTQAVRWASAAGVVGGYPNGSFGPNDPITREQLAAMLYRYAVYQGMESVTLEENLAGFTDADKISGYAIQAMNWAVGQGIMGGYGDNTLRPQGNATRAQAAAMLQRFCEKFGE